MDIAILVSFFMSVAAYAAANSLIHSKTIKDSFIKANLFGKDLNKKSEAKVPEGLGVVSGAVFLVNMFLFIPFSILPSLVAETKAFNHQEFTQFICALLSICCMIFLGFADDILNLRWRHKVLLPTVASLPLLMVYFVGGGSTTIILPAPFPRLGWTQLDLHLVYYLYMGMLAVFCTNAINILAGINGVEVGQSVVIALSISLFNVLELSGPQSHQHIFSLYLILPFIAVSLALLKYNWYPSRVFVGDTYCYFAGMTFAVIGILGHFSKTLLLFFIPQILNFLYSVPQLFGMVPCPRHRLPKFNPTSGLLGLSYAEFHPSELHPLTFTLLKLAASLRLVTMVTGVGEDKDHVRINNLTLINFVIKCVDPCHEQTLTLYMLGIQVLGTMMAFSIRYGLVHFFYPVQT